MGEDEYGDSRWYNEGFVEEYDEKEYVEGYDDEKEYDEGYDDEGYDEARFGYEDNFVATPRDQNRAKRDSLDPYLEQAKRDLLDPYLEQASVDPYLEQASVPRTRTTALPSFGVRSGPSMSRAPSLSSAEEHGAPS